MVGVGRDLCGSSSPSPLPKQGCLQQAAQDLVQAGTIYPFLVMDCELDTINQEEDSIREQKKS